MNNNVSQWPKFLVLIPALTGVASAQALVDPGFENGTFNFPGLSSPEFIVGDFFTDWPQVPGSSDIRAVSGAGAGGAVSLMLREGSAVSQTFNFDASGDYTFSIDAFIFEADVGGTGVSAKVTRAIDGATVLNQTFISDFDGEAEFNVVSVTSDSFNVSSPGAYSLELTGAVGAIGVESPSFALAPVPEPSGAVLSIVGLGMLAGRRKRA